MNELTQLLKLNYDNYYKFLVSLSGIIFLVSSGLLYYLGSNQTLNWFVSFCLTIFLIISFIFFYSGMCGWKKRQNDLDKLLSLDVEKGKEIVEIIKLRKENEQVGLELSKKRIESLNGTNIFGPEENIK